MICRAGLMFLVCFMMFAIDWSEAQSKTCVFRNKGKKFDIQEGEVTSIKKDKVKVCENGKLVQKDKSEVPTPYKIGCNGCMWYGRVICEGNVVKDLHSWWFLSKCAGGKMSAYGRSWLEVSGDKRFQKS
eukprot:GFUD01089962.1.p1 GENE.GFUD01089962.1~~GFUD01089962.1.p1  ORF type:complete len:129 (+),score=38.95 GFUD01089962.1:63-449(+)